MKQLLSALLVLATLEERFWNFCTDDTPNWKETLPATEYSWRIIWKKPDKRDWDFNAVILDTIQRIDVGNAFTARYAGCFYSSEWKTKEGPIKMYQTATERASSYFWTNMAVLRHGTEKFRTGFYRQLFLIYKFFYDNEYAFNVLPNKFIAFFKEGDEHIRLTDFEAHVRPGRPKPRHIKEMPAGTQIRRNGRDVVLYNQLPMALRHALVLHSCVLDFVCDFNEINFEAVQANITNQKAYIADSVYLFLQGQRAAELAQAGDYDAFIAAYEKALFLDDRRLG